MQLETEKRFRIFLLLVLSFLLSKETFSLSSILYVIRTAVIQSVEPSPLPTAVYHFLSPRAQLSQELHTHRDTDTHPGMSASSPPKSHVCMLMIYGRCCATLNADPVQIHLTVRGLVAQCGLFFRSGKSCSTNLTQSEPIYQLASFPLSSLQPFG